MSAIPAWALKGAEVTCISANGQWVAPDGSSPVRPPVKGGVYVIVEADLVDGLCFLSLQDCEPEETFSVRNFAPVLRRSQERGIAQHFSDLLTTDVREPGKVSA